MQRVLVTGGAGFVGSSLCVRLKHAFPETTVLALDNLYRRGSELNCPRLESAGARLLKGDVRDRSLFEMHPCDLIVDAAAEPSVMAGKQVRDVLRVEDLADLVLGQLKELEHWRGEVYNVGGGRGVMRSAGRHSDRPRTSRTTSHGGWQTIRTSWRLSFADRRGVGRRST